MPEVLSRRPAPALARCLLALSLALTAGCGLMMDSEARLERANEAYAEGDYRAAIIDARNVLQKEPDNRAARVLLGRSAVRLRDMATAEKELRRAIDLGEPLANVAEDLGQALLQQRKFDEVLEQIPLDLASGAEQRRSLLKLRGDAMMGLQLPGSARELYQEVLGEDPSDLGARLGVVSSYVAQENYDTARAELDEALALDPSYTSAWLASGSLSLTVRDIDKAIADFTKAGELADANQDADARVSALVGLVEAHLAKNDLPAAREAATRLRELAPQSIPALYLNARVAYLEQDYEAAQKDLQAVLSRAPEYRPAQFLMGAVHLQRGNLGQAEMHLSAVVAAMPQSVDARKLLAETRLRQDRADEAVEILRPILGTEGDEDLAALNLAVRASLEAGDYDEAIQYLRGAVERDPGNNDLRLDLAASYLAAGRVEEAEKLIAAIPEEAGDASYRRDLLRVIAPLRRGDSARALQDAQEMVARWPEDARVRNLIGGIALSADRLDLAKENFAAARELAPDDVSADLNLARIAGRQGDLDTARDEFLAALGKRPGSAPIMVALAEVEARTQNRDAAVSWLEKARAADGGAIRPRLLLANYYLQVRDYASALAVARETVAIDSASAEAHNLIGLARQGLGEDAEAAESFGQAAKLDPEQSAYRFNAIRAQIEAGELDAAEAALRESGGMDPGNLQASVLMAAVKAKQGDTAAALEIARALQSRYPDNGIPLALEAELLATEKQYAEAARIYDRALALRPEDRRLVLRAFRVRTDGGLADPAAPLLAYLERRPLDTAVRTVVAQSYQTAGDPAGAIREYEQVLVSAPDNFVALNNLAWIYHEQGDPRAEETAKRAYEQSPENGSVADTLGWIQVQKGNLDDGIPMLRKAVELSGGRAEVTYHLAAALAKSGQAAEARRLLERALASDESFAGRKAAEELLASL